MYIANSDTVPVVNGIVQFLPRDIRHLVYNIDLEEAGEIRLRLGKPLVIHYTDGCIRYVSQRGNLTVLPQSAVRVTRAQLNEALEIATASSLYSVKNEIRNGYLTVKGGHRIGITGTAVIKGDRIDNIKDVSALNYRLAREVKGAADGVIPLITESGIVKNTLIISPPGAGKTTMLRDIVRQLSYQSLRVSVVDERSEIAALYEGRSSFDLGFSTDVLDGAEKSYGMVMVLRSMSPDVIVTDEIGSKADIDALKTVTNSGAAVITSVHGLNAEMIKRRSELNGLLDFFPVVITLSSRRGAGRVEEALVRW